MSIVCSVSKALIDLIFSQEKQSEDDELSGSTEALSENNTKVNSFCTSFRGQSWLTVRGSPHCLNMFQEKGGIFAGMFKKARKPAEAAQPEEVKV